MAQNNPGVSRSNLHTSTHHKKKGSSMRVVIQSMIVDDILEVHSIERASFNHPWEMSTFFDIIEHKDHYIHIARDATDKLHGAIFGYLILVDVGSEYHLINLAVHPAHRRRGIASQLVGFIIDRAAQNNIGSISLEVRISNHPAISFYTAQGFIPVAIRKQYYKDTNEDAYIMLLKIPDSVHP